MRARVGVVIAAILASSGCGGDTTGPPEPTPGALTVSLSAPPGVTTGAVVLTITGPEAITNATGPAEGHQVYSRADGAGMKVGVFGTIVPGPLVRFDVPDTRNVDEYAAAISEIAGTDNTLKSLTGYTLRISD